MHPVAYAHDAALSKRSSRPRASPPRGCIPEKVAIVVRAARVAQPPSAGRPPSLHSHPRAGVPQARSRTVGHRSSHPAPQIGMHPSRKAASPPETDGCQVPRGDPIPDAQKSVLDDSPSDKPITDNVGGNIRAPIGEDSDGSVGCGLWLKGVAKRSATAQSHRKPSVAAFG